ncbi:MAG: LPS export ABC transporter permease LptF [Gammaproteobacteria bacterium]|nr:LPS export ABC transporter permease LptF [Gammaproteobacteria bacterium]NNF60278.1 LPS export ABC transporter permease LptF [Gammaproteobacteria bacterium]NNM20386.1 LPS export ABC transporter permease LptF [Gammaproteobacteria bacterium]
MRSIINKYLTREVFSAWLAVTVVLLFILLSNQFARVLGDAAAGKLPRDAVFQIIGLTSITYLTVLVPVSLFLAVMLALGRLYMDSEMSAINACGIGPLRVYRAVFVVSLILTMLLAWLSMYASPWAARQAQVITEKSKQQAGLGALEPGRFRSDNGVVFYAERVDEDGVMRNVFLQRRRGQSIEVAVAESGQVIRNADETTVLLRNGRRYEGEPGTVNFRIVRFGEHGIPVARREASATALEREALPTSQLLGSSRPADAAELHWRIAAPISAMLLGLLAVPLARTRPRQGRYGRLAIGVAVYLVYANLLGAAQVWIQQGKLPPLVGMWPVHALLAAAAGVLYWRELRLRKPKRVAV